MRLATEQIIKDTTNMGDRQECGILPLIFNLYLDSVAHQWKQQLGISNVTNNLRPNIIFYLSYLQMTRLLS
jgi:hypothetical protein